MKLPRGLLREGIFSKGNGTHNRYEEDNWFREENSGWSDTGGDEVVP